MCNILIFREKEREGEREKERERERLIFRDRTLEEKGYIQG